VLVALVDAGELGLGLASGSLPSEAQPPTAIATAATVANTEIRAEYVMSEFHSALAVVGEERKRPLADGRRGRRARILRHIWDAERCSDSSSPREETRS